MLISTIHSSLSIVNYNSTSFTQTTATHKTKDLVEFTTRSSVVPKIMTSIKSLIITSFQTASFTQSTSSTNSNVKSETRPSITPYFTTLSSIDSTTSMSINSINTHNYKQQSQIRISSTTVAATITFNISPSTFDSTQSTFNIVQSIIDTNQRSAGANNSTIITISVTIVVLSIILILIIIIVIFSMVMIVKRRQKYNLGNNIIFIFV